MSANHSVTLEINRLKSGEEDALEVLWSRYQQRLTRLARKSLGATACRVFDEDDVVQSALLSFWQRTTDNGFVQLENRTNLLCLLQMIVKRKASDYRAAEHRQKRGGGKVRGESVFLDRSGEERAGIDSATATDRTPCHIAAAREMTTQMMECLGDDTLRDIVLWKTEGYTIEEIAEFLACSRSTVIRKTDLIRKIWSASACN